MFKLRQFVMTSVLAVAFGFGFAASDASAWGSNCYQCWGDCEAEFYRCLDYPSANVDACRITFYSCGIGCGCEIP